MSASSDGVSGKGAVSKSGTCVVQAPVALETPVSHMHVQS